MMDPSVWRQVAELFDEASRLDAQERAAWLESRKPSLPSSVLEELLTLLDSHDAASATNEKSDPSPSHRPRLDLDHAPDPARLLEQLRKVTRAWEDLPPGTRLEGFEILRRLGGGLQASVYLARELALDRPVALKLSADTGAEARTMAQLEHDAVVRVFAEHRWPERGLRAVVMQFISGASLEAVLRQLGPRPATGRAILEVIDACRGPGSSVEVSGLEHRERFARLDACSAALQIGEAVARALAMAHRLGTLHLDVKPANILLDACGRAYLADFNVSARSEVGSPGTELEFAL